MSLLEQIDNQLPKRPEPEYADRSDLEAFAVCPHRGQLLRKYPQLCESHDELCETGEIVHAIAEEAIKACDMNLQEAADFITEELPKARPDLQPEVLRGGRAIAMELRRFAANRVLACEDQISRTIIEGTYGKPEVIVTTAPDLVLASSKEGVIHHLDWKTGYLKRSNQDARDCFQSCVQCWTEFGKYPDVHTIHQWYIQTRWGTRAYACITRDDEPVLETRIAEAVRLWREGCDDAWPSESKCAICDVISKCKYAEEICRQLDGDIAGFVDNTVVLRDVVNRREQIMKKACKNGRRLYGSNMYFDDTPKKAQRRFSFKEAKEAKGDDNNGEE